MIIERLRFWRGKHGRFPTKIIVYRDGVSEGQYKLVLDNELPAFNAAFEELYGKTPPKLAIIIVGKRHHTRFYPTETNYTGEFFLRHCFFSILTIMQIQGVLTLSQARLSIAESQMRTYTTSIYKHTKASRVLLGLHTTWSSTIRLVSVRMNWRNSHTLCATCSTEPPRQFLYAHRHTTRICFVSVVACTCSEP